METSEQIAREYNISDYDAGNDRDKMYLGIITKLRGKNRELANNLETVTTRHSELENEVTTFRRTAKENDIINSVLGDKKEIGDKAKFEKWKAKLANGDSWEDDLKDLVADFAVEKKTEQKKETPPPASDDKKKSETPSPDDKKSEETPEEQKKSGYTSRQFRGKTEEIAGTSIRAPRTPSERLKLMAEDKDAYDDWRASKGR